MAHINIPENPDGVIKLLDDIIEKEDSLAPNGTLSKEELEELKKYRDAAKEARRLQQDYLNKSQEQTRKMDNALGGNASVSQKGSAKYIYTSLKKQLSGKYQDNLKTLTQWGFNVVDDPEKRKPEQPSK
jgi:hypothetical protein